MLLLGAALLTASFPFFASLARTPEELFFGEGVFVLSQSSARQPLTEELAEELGAETWVDSVSPEVYAFLGLGGRAVVARGVQPDTFLALEGVGVATPLRPEFLLVGGRLAAKLGLEAGDTLLLPGSVQPLILEASVDAILPPQGVVADEMLLDLPRARLLAGLAGSALSLLRVQVRDGDRLLAYLASAEREVVVTGEGASHLVEGGIVLDDRIGSLLLTNPALGRELGRAYIGSFAQHSGNSLRVLILGMEGLTILLLLVILGSSLTRYWVERRREVGLLRALGGRGPAALRIFAGRLLALGLLATAVGLLVGVGIGKLLEAGGAYAFLGHALPYPLEAGPLFLLGGLYLAAFGVVVLLGLAFLLRQSPRDLLHEVPEPSPEDEEGPKGDQDTPAMDLPGPRRHQSQG